MKQTLPLLLLTALAVVAPGCHKKAAPVEPPVAAETPATDGVKPAEPSPPPAVAAVGDVAVLSTLTQAADPYLSNNAKAALLAWKKHQYVEAVTSVRTALSLRLTPAQQETVMSAAAGMMSQLETASSGGNKEAKTALEQLRGTLNGQ